MDIHKFNQWGNVVHELFSVQEIVSKKIWEILEIFDTHNENIDELIKKTNKKINEIGRDIENILPPHSADKDYIVWIWESTKKAVLVSFLFWSMMTDKIDESTAYHTFLLVINDESYEKIYTIGKKNETEPNTKMIIPYLKKVAQIKYGRERKNIHLDDEFLAYLQQVLKERFPKLGNSKFASITSKKNKEEIEKKFRTEAIPGIIEDLIDAIEKKFHGSKKMDEVVYRATQWIDMFFMNDIDEAYNQFASTYIIQEMKNANRRKEGQSTPPKTKENTPSWKTNMIQKINQEEKIIQEEKKFLDTLFTNEAHKKEIVKYVIRLYRNKKKIRISDLQEKFKISENIFTKELLDQGKTLNIVFITDDEKVEQLTEKTTKKEIEQCQTIQCKEKSEKEKIQEKINIYSESKDIPTLDDCMYMLELAGYEFQNKKSFIKECNNLYKKPKEIREFAQDLKKNILEINDKMNAAKQKPYKNIALKGDKRILFFEKNIIDGIYNHNEYMKRLNNQ